LLVETAVLATVYWALKRHIQSRPLRWD
jgi:hypothetical protein